MRKTILIFLSTILLTSWLPVQAQLPSGIDVYRLIQENKIDSVAFFLESGHDINGIYPKNTLLEMAISLNNMEAVEFLISKGANVNLQNNRSTPLYLAVSLVMRHKTNKIVETLVSNDADINFVAFTGLTPFTLACRIGNSEAVRYLYENGADPTIKDRTGKDFMYYVLRGEDFSLISYFTSAGFEIPRMPSVADGPYVSINENGSTTAFSMKYDSISDKAEWSQIELPNDAEWLPTQEQIDWFLQQNPKNDQFVFKKVENIFVVSDIHGHFDDFVGLLMANNIIDDKFNWIFGNGHLVVAGDIFDRGNMVTECLWLIFKLDYQAQMQGGIVHVLLGNHELMIIHDNNKAYLHDKYVIPYAKAGIDTYELFNENYLLGKWLRTKNIVIRLNNTLIVHGGIAPDFVVLRRSIDLMNNAMHAYINGNTEVDEAEVELIIDPVWYRGYFDKTDMSADISAICKFYKAKKIVVGHTTVDKVHLLQGNLVVGVDVHFTGPSRPAEGLMIHKGKYYRCDAIGKRYPL